MRAEKMKTLTDEAEELGSEVVVDLLAMCEKETKKKKYSIRVPKVFSGTKKDHEILESLGFKVKTDKENSMVEISWKNE